MDVFSVSPWGRRRKCDLTTCAANVYPEKYPDPSKSWRQKWTKKPPAKSRFGTHPSIGGSLGILRDHQLRNHETHEAIRPGDSTHRGEIRLGGVARICGIHGWKIWVKQFDQQQDVFLLK